MTVTCIWTMLATHLTTMSLTVPHLLFFIMCSKGLVQKIFRGSAGNYTWKSHLRKSFWKWKFDSSPFWMNFWASCLRNYQMHCSSYCVCTTLKTWPSDQQQTIPEGVNSKEGDILNCVHPHQVEVLPKNLVSNCQCGLKGWNSTTCHILDHWSLILPML